MFISKVLTHREINKATRKRFWQQLFSIKTKQNKFKQIIKSVAPSVGSLLD